MDFFKNRFCGYGHCVFSREFLCKKDDENETGIKSHTGWYPDDASGTSADSSRFLSAADLQSETTIRGISAGEF